MKLGNCLVIHLRLKVVILTGAESVSNVIKFTTSTEINIVCYTLCEDWDFQGDVSNDYYRLERDAV
jgi:hypothetical protein